MGESYANVFTAIVAAGITDSATSVTVDAAVPGAGASDTFRLRNERTGELLNLTAGANTTTWTIARAAEDASRFPAAAMLTSDELHVVLTAAALRALPGVAGNFSVVGTLTAQASPVTLGVAAASTLITTPGTDLILEETGDSLGDVRLHLQNRSGVNGAILENVNVDLVDFIFRPSSGSGNQLSIRMEARTSADYVLAPEFHIGTAGDPALIVSKSSGVYVRKGPLYLITTAGLYWWDGTTVDCRLERHAARVLRLQDGSNPMEWQVYTTRSNDSNYERLALRGVAAGDHVITPEAAGTGTLRGLKIVASGGRLGFFGTTAIAQETIAAAASDPATTQTLANDLRTKLINLGLVAA